MRVLRKLVSLLLTPLFMATLLVQVTAVTASATVLSPTYVKRVLQGGVYGALQGLVADRAASAMRTGQLQLTPAEARALVAQVLPTYRVHDAIEPLVDNLYAWLHGIGERPIMVIDLTRVRNDLAPALRQLIDDRIARLPPCPTGQIPSMQAGFPTCRPLGVSAAVMQAAFNVALSDQALVGSVPERVDVTGEIERQQGPDIWRRLNRLRASIRLLTTLAIWGWLAVAGLAALLWMLNRDRPHTPLGWLAWPALLIGLLLCGAVLLAAAAMAMPPPADPALAAVMEPLWQGLIAGLRRVALLAGLATAGAGLVLLLARQVVAGAAGRAT